jgi:hypothetical protein
MLCDAALRFVRLLIESRRTDAGGVCAARGYLDRGYLDRPLEHQSSPAQHALLKRKLAALER